MTWNIQKFLLQLKYQAMLKVLWLLNIPFLVEVTGGGLRPVVRLEKLDIHVMTSHDHTCVQCVQNGLSDHLQLHSGDVLHISTQCEKRFPSYSSLNRYMNVHSSKHRCSECGKCLCTVNAFLLWQQFHSGEKPFECSVCRKQFTQSGNLTGYSRIHSGEKPYKCHMCEKAFSQSAHVNTHIRVPHGRETIQVFSV